MTKVIELVEMQWKAADFKDFFPQQEARGGAPAKGFRRPGRDAFSPPTPPGAEAPGYFQSSLRDLKHKAERLA